MSRLASVIAVVCLLAAGQVRADDLRAPGGASEPLLSATTATPACVTLRPNHPRPVWRTWPYDPPGAPIVPPPPRTGARLAPRVAAHLSDPAPPVPCSRGPPRG